MPQMLGLYSMLFNASTLDVWPPIEEAREVGEGAMYLAC